MNTLTDWMLRQGATCQSMNGSHGLRFKFPDGEKIDWFHRRKKWSVVGTNVWQVGETELMAYVLDRKPREPVKDLTDTVPASIKPTCQACQSNDTRLVTGLAVYPHRPDLDHKRFWKCQCGAYCGCHPGTSNPLGYPANAATRKARNQAHAIFDPLWKTGIMRRSEAYSWLAGVLGIERDACHIGMMDEAMALRVVEAVRAR